MDIAKLNNFFMAENDIEKKNCLKTFLFRPINNKKILSVSNVSAFEKTNLKKMDQH